MFPVWCHTENIRLLQLVDDNFQTLSREGWWCAPLRMLASFSPSKLNSKVSMVLKTLAAQTILSLILLALDILHFAYTVIPSFSIMFILSCLNLFVASAKHHVKSLTVTSLLLSDYGLFAPIHWLSINPHLSCNM